MSESDLLPDLLRHPEFILGAAKPSQFPQDDIPEVAFAGRSNVGKSSAINALTQRRKLARTSKVPGRTQQINFFSLGERARLVDLPGYGFAQVPLTVKQAWEKTIHSYLSSRPNLLVLVLLMDSRHPMTDLDRQMLDWAFESELPTQILLTKADKLKNSRLRATQLAVEKELAARFSKAQEQFAVEVFSSLNGTGVAAMRLQMAEWLSQ